MYRAMFVPLLLSAILPSLMAVIHRKQQTPKLRPRATVQDNRMKEELRSNPAQMTDFDLKESPVWIFGKAQLESDKNKEELTSLLGGKGSNLATMGKIGLCVPPGFTLTTEVCHTYHQRGESRVLPENVWTSVLNGVKSIEDEMGYTFGDVQKPLLVSVRSGAAISMPGMMDTILNLGLNDETVEGLAKNFGERFAMDSYRRFLHMFGTVVMNLPHEAFEVIMHDAKKEQEVSQDSDLSSDVLKSIVTKYKDIYIEHGKSFPHDPYLQLKEAIFAVFDSWQSTRAIKYREAEGIKGLLGTAVNVQAMVFGNMGDTSGTGVCFTRDPNTGARGLYGEYLINAQGEDVVAGIRTPDPIQTLNEKMPAAYSELLRNVDILEKHYSDMQDIEFTIQEERLFMLQTRGGKRTGQAAINIALDLVEQGLATKDQAIKTVHSGHLKQLLHAQFAADLSSAEYKDKVCARGLPASPGAAVGKVVFTPEAAESGFAEGEKCILVRDETSPEDVGGMWAAEGILTARGGMTSHAAVVARGWGKPCICGCEALRMSSTDEVATLLTLSGEEIQLREGDIVSINGDTGELLLGEQRLKPPSIDSAEGTKKFMSWVDQRRRLRVLANADTPADALEARKNGAQGIGLTRTEHMFFDPDRIKLVRRMILAKDDNGRLSALNELLPFQKQDFKGILEAMDSLPVTVRLLDPPLHEFLPDEQQIDDSFASDMGYQSAEECKEAVRRLEEVNPMLGLRGCRLGIVLPELVDMQTRALLEAALDLKYQEGLDPRPELMVPLVSSSKEFIHQADLIRATMKDVFKSYGEGEDIDVYFKIGTMIETPRAALRAETIASAGAEFFSYGTNDLTQMTYGFSRDDVGTYLPTYIREGIMERDPFETIDEYGVGELIRKSMKMGRQVANGNSDTNLDTTDSLPPFKAGICGEHGGDARSVRKFSDWGLDYVSCSPFRVPIARLAAAQAVIEEERREDLMSKGADQIYKRRVPRRRRMYIKERYEVATLYSMESQTAPSNSKGEIGKKKASLPISKKDTRSTKVGKRKERILKKKNKN